MLIWFAGIQRKITDFIVGGKTRTKFEAIAVEMEAQDLQFFIAARKAIATSVYQGFNFNLFPAIKASGNITFYATPAPSSDITIPAGTKVSTTATNTTTEKLYQTTTDATMPAGQNSVTVPILASTEGTGSNTGVNTIINLKTSISGITSLTNQAAIANGSDKETETNRRVRFQEYISTLTRGTASALVFGARSTNLTDIDGNITEQVVSAVVTGPPGTGSAGSCDLYIFNGSTGASSSLVTAVQTAIDGDTTNNTPGYKAAGIVVAVHAATTLAKDVTMSVVSTNGTDTAALQAAIQTTISNYLTSFGIGDPFLYNELIERVMGLSGVYNIAISEPTGDVTPTNTQVLIPGTISVTVT